MLGVLLLAGCESPAPDPGAERLAKTWPSPAASADEATGLWTYNNGYLTLWRPDPSIPADLPVPGHWVLSLRCAAVDRLEVETSIVIATDVGGAPVPFDTLTLEAGGLKLVTPLRRAVGEYSVSASGDFTVDRTRLETALSAPYLVVRPLVISAAHDDAHGSPDEDWGERYLAPTREARTAFLKNCGIR